MRRRRHVILDEFGYLPFARTGGQLPLHLVGRPRERAWEIVSANLAFGEWRSVFGDPRMIKLLLDCLTHH